MPKVSIVIPVYGVEQYLEQCLDSVLTQSLEDIEIICVDDASPDRCPAILDDYEARYPQIRVFHLEKNRKQGYGRNLGIAEASGKYVYFLDSDDMIVPEAMKTLYDIAENEQLEGILFDAQAIYESQVLQDRYSETFIGRRKGTYPAEACEGQLLAGEMLDNKDWTVLVQRTFWQRAYLMNHSLFFPEDAIHEDQFFTTAAVLAARRIKYVPKPLFIRRFRDNSVVTTPAAPENFYGYLISILHLLSFLRRENIKNHPVEMLMMHLFRHLDRLYPVFNQNADPEEWFKDEESAKLYSFYRYVQKTREWEKEYDEKIFESLNRDMHIWIYGCGRIGKRLYQRLIRLGFCIKGFIVTDPSGNPNEVYGVKVISLDEYQPAENEVVVVAMASDNHEEVSKKLDRRSIVHYLYANDIVKGPYDRTKPDTAERSNEDET